MDKTRAALVSVVVPLHNDERFIADCLRSIQRQHGTEFEVVVVDDCGSDSSVNVVQDLMARDDRVRLIRHDRNRGLAASRNTGVAHARSASVTFLDADDFLFPGALDGRFRRLKYKSGTDSSIAGSYCGWDMVAETASIDDQPTGEAKNKRLRYIDVAGRNPLIATAPLLWRHAVIDTGGFDESFSTAEDFDFWTRLLRQGYEIVPTGKIGVAYRQKRSSMIADGLAAHAAAAIRVLDYVDRPLEPNEVSPNAPGPFREGIAGHRRQLVLIGRLAVFLAIAIGSENERERDELLALIPERARVTDFKSVTGVQNNIAAGVRRFELQSGPLTEMEREELAATTLGALMAHVKREQPVDPAPTADLTAQWQAALRRGVEFVL